MNRNTVLGWTQGLWLCSPSPRREIHSELRQAGQSGKKDSQSSTQYLPASATQPAAGGGGGGVNEATTVPGFSQQEAESVPPPLEPGLALALLWAKEWGGGSDDVWLPSLPVNRPGKLLLSSPGPGDHQTRMKVLGRQRPGSPSPSSWLQRRPQERRQGAPPPQVSHRIRRHTDCGTEARKWGLVFVGNND